MLTIYQFLRNFFGYSIVVSLLVGCASFDPKINTIQPGDTKEKITAILGEPEDRQFNGKSEAWQYCKTGTGFGKCGFKTIWFNDSRVTKVVSYSTDCAGFGSCTQHFKSIRWDDAPDHTIEIRER
jgi:hypothetical protein